MSIILPLTSTNHIPPKLLSECKLDNKSLSEICSIYQYKEAGALYNTRVTCVYAKLGLYLWKNYNISISDYFEKIGYIWPICPITNLKVNFTFKGSNSVNGLKINKFHNTAKLTKENSEAFKKGCEKLSNDRKGKKNPMFGATPWNKNKTKENCNIMKNISQKRIGIKISEESKEKMREARRKSPLKARHTTKHSRETIEKLRQHSAKLHAIGAYKKVSSIHIKMKEFLPNLNLKQPFIEEFQIKYFSVDFAFPSIKIAIECDGDYFHCNPIYYPNGPTTKTQRRNFGRDMAKNKFLKNEGWTVLRFWENQINSKIYEESLKCKLKELNLLDK